MAFKPTRTSLTKRREVPSHPLTPVTKQAHHFVPLELARLEKNLLFRRRRDMIVSIEEDPIRARFNPVSTSDSQEMTSSFFWLSFPDPVTSAGGTTWLMSI